MLTCNDCHVPHGLVSKWLSKAENGFRHSVAFTFSPPDTIRAKPRTRRVLQQNCFHCHGEMVFLVAAPGEQPGRTCFDCHQGVGRSF